MELLFYARGLLARKLRSTLFQGLHWAISPDTFTSIDIKKHTSNLRLTSIPNLKVLTTRHLKSCRNVIVIVRCVTCSWAFCDAVP